MSDEEQGAQAALIAEQLRHTIALLRAEIGSLKAEQKHMQEMAGHRLGSLEQIAKDHEDRLRTVTDGVVQFKMWSGLASSGSWCVSVAALLRAWFGA